ncbi:MAG: hypothetical protein MK179_16860, partial [Pirellulaceae bacterium]|nr:hypothetical protein [Pirellulaceae bacterium]
KPGRVGFRPDVAVLGPFVNSAFGGGGADHVEIWNRERWTAYQTDQQQRYDEIAESAFERNPPVSEGRE